MDKEEFRARAALEFAKMLLDVNDDEFVFYGDMTAPVIADRAIAMADVLAARLWTTPTPSSFGGPPGSDTHVAKVEIDPAAIPANHEKIPHDVEPDGRG